MKLRNKKTGEILDYTPTLKRWNGPLVNRCNYNSLAELNEEWEDVPEEPKEWWYIDIHGPHKVTNNDEYYQQVKAASKEIGNYFSSREEAEKAVEKLKAWKRLKDEGLKLELRSGIARGEIRYYLVEESDETEKDLRTCFGGKE